MRLVTVACLMGLLLVSTSARALTPAPVQTPTPAATSGPTANTPTTAYSLPPDKLAKAKALYDLRSKLRIIGTIYGLAVLLAILYLGVMARYRDWAEKASGSKLLRGIALILAISTLVLAALALAHQIPKATTGQKLLHALLLLVTVALVYWIVTHRKWVVTFSQALIAVPLFLLTVDILELPLSAYEHSVSRQYGLSVQSWSSWFVDQLKGEALAWILGTFILWLMIVIIRWSPRRWWIWFWFPVYAVFLLLAYAGPLIIDPWFNKFEPLQKDHPQLVDALERVTQRGGLAIPRDRMFLMKASEKTNELNAYVTGFGPSKRVVVWDTTIQKTSTPETLFVFGHEMGHYVLNHIVYGMAFAAIGIFIALYLIYLVSGWMLRHFAAHWRIRELGDWAALPMIFLILSIFAFFSEPAANSISRQMEHNADIYGLEVTHGINPDSQEAGAHAFQRLGEISLVYPYPSRFVTFWYGSHPSIPERVRFAHEYDPWGKGEPPKYVK